MAPLSASHFLVVPLTFTQGPFYICLYIDMVIKEVFDTAKRKSKLNSNDTLVGHPNRCVYKHVTWSHYRRMNRLCGVCMASPITIDLDHMAPTFPFHASHWTPFVVALTKRSSQRCQPIYKLKACRTPRLGREENRSHFVITNLSIP